RRAGPGGVPRRRQRCARVGPGSGGRDTDRRAGDDSVERPQRAAGGTRGHSADAVHRARVTTAGAVTWDDLLEGEELAHVETVEAAEPRIAPLPDELSPQLRAVLPFDGLYEHQREAWDA